MPMHSPNKWTGVGSRCCWLSATAGAATTSTMLIRGITGARSDGGIDLELRRNDEHVVVQVEHWNACPVPHNTVHELRGLMVDEARPPRS